MGEWKGMLGSKSGNKGKVDGEGAPSRGMAPDLSRSDYDLNQANDDDDNNSRQIHFRDFIIFKKRRIGILFIVL